MTWRWGRGERSNHWQEGHDWGLDVVGMFAVLITAMMSHVHTHMHRSSYDNCTTICLWGLEVQLPG